MSGNSQLNAQSSVRPYSVFALLVGALLIAPGCGKVDGPKLTQVVGTVTKDGAPVPNVVVVFTPLAANAAQASGEADENGVYQLRYSNGETGAPLGECRVELIVSPPAQSDEEGAPSPPPLTYALSDTVTVQSGENKFDFQLEKLGTPRQ